MPIRGRWHHELPILEPKYTIVKNTCIFHRLYANAAGLFLRDSLKAMFVNISCLIKVL